MHNTLTVLRAIVRLSRTRSNITLEALTERSSGTPTETRRAVHFLATEGLVLVTERGVRPTLPGLAIAVASGAARARATTRAKDSKKVDRARRAA